MNIAQILDNCLNILTRYRLVHYGKTTHNPSWKIERTG